MLQHDLTPGERIACPSCGAAYEVTADGMIETREDARCQGCRHIMVKWRQYVGLRPVEPDNTTPNRTA